MFNFFKRIEAAAFRGIEHMLSDAAKLKDEFMEHAAVKTVEGISLTNLAANYGVLAQEAHDEAGKAKAAAEHLEALVVPQA